VYIESGQELIYLPPPLVYQVRLHHYQRGERRGAGEERQELRGLPQPHLVREQQPPVVQHLRQALLLESAKLTVEGHLRRGYPCGPRRQLDGSECVFPTFRQCLFPSVLVVYLERVPQHEPIEVAQQALVGREPGHALFPPVAAGEKPLRHLHHCRIPGYTPMVSVPVEGAVCLAARVGVS